jgi:hypothetical protein
MMRGRDEVRQDIATAFAKNHGAGCYGPASFIGIFRHETLAENQTLGMALAEWHALFSSVAVFSLWNALGTADSVLPIVGLFQHGVVEAVENTCQDEFLSIVNAREKDYLPRIVRALESNDSVDSVKLSGLMVRKITGDYDEALEATGVHAPTDAMTAVVLWNLVLSDIMSSKEFLKSSKPLLIGK